MVGGRGRYGTFGSRVGGEGQVQDIERQGRRGGAGLVDGEAWWVWRQDSGKWQVQ